MKTPNKIYIQTNKGEAFSSKWTTIPFRDFENTEYIRKNALLEIINVEKTRHTERRSIEGIAACHALNDLIKQLELYDIK